jgi:hypothetical protein
MQNLVATGGADGHLILWSVHSKQRFGDMTMPTGAGVDCLAWLHRKASKAGRNTAASGAEPVLSALATISGDGHLRFWGVRSGVSLQLSVSAFPSSLCVGKRVASPLDAHRAPC